jgi:hypothetical protein
MLPVRHLNPNRKTADLSRLTSKKAVLDAMAEFDRLGRDRFLEEYGYHRAKSVFVRYQGKTYDQRAIIGVAYGKQYPSEGPLDRSTFWGGRRTGIRLLTRHGFEVV